MGLARKGCAAADGVDKRPSFAALHGQVPQIRLAVVYDDDIEEMEIQPLKHGIEGRIVDEDMGMCVDGIKRRERLKFLRGKHAADRLARTFRIDFRLARPLAPGSSQNEGQRKSKRPALHA